ncbi:unnamed protein product [Kuraishia capsulata CBS 1993]|uniref:ATPase inhibitor, mitochondrial n=1 Tax=Kuraishia capsulata CBS 1993 TaxID=1382522 RepID=W6MS06_9ASCO|nr:uncharacterized protein KUCA_T00005543001 [Kuraishia capsulata CBS 1993]CDK29551.1 unnamed protein product [Kuraishia capsulata CBS 1993]
MFSRRALTSVARANRTVALRFYSEGATGAPRSDGSGDAFTIQGSAVYCPQDSHTNYSSPQQKREKAQEDLYIKKHQAEQLAALKEQIKKQKESLDELEKKINSI